MRCLKIICGQFDPLPAAAADTNVLNCYKRLFIGQKMCQKIKRGIVKGYLMKGVDVAGRKVNSKIRSIDLFRGKGRGGVGDVSKVLNFLPHFFRVGGSQDLS